MGKKMTLRTLRKSFYYSYLESNFIVQSTTVKYCHKNSKTVLQPSEVNLQVVLSQCEQDTLETDEQQRTALGPVWCE